MKYLGMPPSSSYFINLSVDRHLIRPGKSSAANSWTCFLQPSRMAHDYAAFVDLSAALQWTIDFSSGNSMTLQKTAHYVELFKICCQVEDSMLSWTTTAADGETRRTACPRAVYYLQYCLTYTQTTSHFTMEPGTLSMQMIYVLQPNIHPSLR